MTSPASSGAPAWLTDAHEMPVDPGEAAALWSENYLTYVWSPGNSIGIYCHLCRTLNGVEIWNEQVVVALPGERYLVSKGQSRGYIGNGEIAVCGLSFRVDQPFRSLTKTFRGGARLLTRKEYEAGPVEDGIHVPVEWTLRFNAMSPPFDMGTPHLDQSWAVGHYEQHGILEGSLSFCGERYELSGTGLRDHSWGARDYREIGTTTWLHAQFPQSGRSLMAVLVTGKAPRPEFTYATLSTADKIAAASAEGLPRALSLQDAFSDYTFRFAAAGGEPSTIRAVILDATRAALVGESEIALGILKAPQANHHYIDAFTRFEWDGEVGYGLTERSVDLT